MRLVVDWDGTCTAVDGLHMILEEFGDLDVYRQMEGVLGDGLTLHEVIDAELATVTLPLADAVDWIRERVTLRPGFHELARSHRPLIVSSGFHELIEPVLAREGVDLDVLANSLDPRADGWRPMWRDASVCAVCGEACKRNTLAGSSYVYVGDGYSDRCAAAAAQRVFARAGLAQWCEERSLPYEPFDDLCDVVAALR